MRYLCLTMIEPSPRSRRRKICGANSVWPPRLPRSEAQEPDAKLCWSSGADYDFAKESILAHVPQDSGVYALDHFGIQLFIGESVNLREALLRHVSRRHFQTNHGLPTGFSFEVSSARNYAPKKRAV